MPDDPPAEAADVDEAAEMLSSEDQALVDAAVVRMAAEVRAPRCPAHHPTARLIADLSLAEQLEAVASCLPCEWTVSGLRPGSLAAALLKQCAHAIRHLIGQRDKAIELVRMFNEASGEFIGASYGTSRVGQEVAEYLAEVDGSPAYAEPPCSCVPVEEGEG